MDERAARREREIKSTVGKNDNARGGCARVKERERGFAEK